MIAFHQVAKIAKLDSRGSAHEGETDLLTHLLERLRIAKNRQLALWPDLELSCLSGSICLV